MFLQKTGLRIKHLISPRRRSDSYESSGDQREVAFDKTHSVNIPRRVSWRTSETSFVESTPLQPSERNEVKRNLPRPITNESASSSASSLCSCGCEVKPSTPQYSLSTTEAAPNHTDALYIRPLSLSPPRCNFKPWKSTEPNNSLRSSLLEPSRTDELATNCEPGDSNSTFDLLEALSIELEDAKRTSAQIMQNIEETNTETLSDDVEQLIRETDQAFMAVGTALADARASSRSWYDYPDGDSTSTYVSPPAENIPIPARGVAKRQSVVPRPVIVASKAKRRISVVKKKQKKGGLISRAFRSAPTAPTNTPRWTLTDMTTNMVDALSVKMFRTEVNELLPSKKFQQIREAHHQDIERRMSSDTLHTDDTNASDTPTEPFHLEDLSSRLGEMYPPEPILPPPPIPRLVRRPQSRLYKPRDEYMHIDDLRFPSPPERAASWSRQPRSSISSLTLPAIPKISPFQTPITSAPRVIDFPDTFDLSSTKYTLTSPCFQHGPIRFSRSDLEDKRSRHAREKRYTPLHQMWEENEPLDWTAFQIAILGSVDEDLENAEDLDMKDDMWAWWEELGIGGPGRLLKNFATPESSTEVNSEEGDLSVSSGIFERENDTVQKDDAAVKAPILTHRDIFATGLEVDTRYSFPSSPSTDQLVFKAMRVQFEFKNQQQENTPDSLPPSPMFDFVMTHGEEGKEKVTEEVVPMGFNIGHDLEDFLEWEAKYRHIAYADGEGDDLYEA